MLKKADTPLLNRHELTEALGLSTSSINNYIVSGMPVKERGKQGRASLYCLDDVKHWILHNVKSLPAPDENMNEAKLRKLQAEASLAEMELQQERKELVEISEVIKQVAAEYSTVRAKLLALPTKMGGIVYSLQDQNSVTQALDNAIREVLQELSADTADGIGKHTADEDSNHESALD